MVQKEAGQSAVEGRGNSAGEVYVPSLGNEIKPVVDVGSSPIPSVEPADPIAITREVFGPDAPMALAIAQAESGLNCGAHSPTNDGGLFQINLDWHIAKFGHESPYDCLANARVAKEIFDAQGWSP